MGALEFEPAMDAPYDPHARFEIDSLVDVAKEALADKNAFDTNLNNDKKQAIAEILRLGTSAGGQRAKAIIAYNKKTGEVRSGQVDAPTGFDYYLIKLDGVSAKAGFKETENYGRLEYSFYKLVKACGIDMTECSLIEENGRAHFLTKRFDRKNGKKVHMQTLCGMAHYDYRLHRAYSYEQAFNVNFEMAVKTPSFQRGVERLMKGLEKGFRISLMCSEANPLECHRFSLVSRYFYDNGLDVQHILKDAELASHKALEEEMINEYLHAKKHRLPEIDQLFGSYTKEDQRRDAYRLKNKEIGYKPQLELEEVY